MNIYISHSTSYPFREELYQPIRKYFTSAGATFTLPHENSDEQFDIGKLFPSLDMIIAEVSFASTGQGIELGYASTLEIPIFCIYQYGSSYSGALVTISDKFYSYKSEIELLETISTIIKDNQQIAD